MQQCMWEEMYGASSKESYCSGQEGGWKYTTQQSGTVMWLSALVKGIHPT